MELILPSDLIFIILLSFSLGFVLGRKGYLSKISHALSKEGQKQQANEQNDTKLIDPQGSISPSIFSHVKTNSSDQLLHQRLGALDISTIDIQHTTDWDRALKLAQGNIQCLFITGVAGTGKSTLLKYFVSNTDKRVVVLAPTGVAALNVGGQTIHSFFRFPPGPIHDIESIPIRGELFRSLDTVVIDEVSMVRSDLMDAVDKSMRINRGNPNIPFGGAQLIFIGDLFQLPPVVREREEGEYFTQYYESPFFFDAKVFSDLELRHYKLTTVYRQTDPIFMEILNRIRVNKIQDSDLNTLNCRVDPTYEPSLNSGFIELTTTNRMADIKNFSEMQKLSLPEIEYSAEVEGEFKESQYPTDFKLQLRRGAQIMMLNNDAGRRWVNGTVALIEELTDKTVKIRIPTPTSQPDRICEVSSHTWDISRYRINHTTGLLESEVVGSFTQLPIRLAWAITIHKSQGKTLDRAIIDLSQGTFAHGQAYVALSRCSTLGGIILRSPIKRQDVIVDQRVFRFMQKIKTDNR